MIPPAVLVAERVRQRLRGTNTDPTLDRDAAHTVAVAEVRRYNDVALARGESLIDDETACVRDVLASVHGFGALQPLLDDPEVEEIWLNGADGVHIARGGRSERIDLRLSDVMLRDLV